MTTMAEDRAAKPYGDVTYADPENGKYPIDTEAHIRAAWSYINMPKNAAVYPLNGVTLESVKSRIRAAMKRIGAEVGDGDNDADDRAGSRASFELRKRRRASMLHQAERRGMLVEVRAKPDGTGGTAFEFDGYGAVFDAPFEMWDRWGEPYTEVVKPGAFTRSLARRDLDVPFLVGHDDKRLAMARTKNGTMQLSQDSSGLHVHARMDGRRSDVRDLAYAVERGDQDEMSIGFVTEGQSWSDDYETRNMLDLDMHRGDVSSVALAANPATAGSSIAFPAETLRRRNPAAEQRANPIDQNLGDSPDYNPWKNMPGAQQCENCDAMQSPAAKFCDSCGGDALIRVNDDGVPAMEEEQGAAASLGLRRRQLELLKLGRGRR
jgi:HK97 family phage prohead protease